jgi:hypothetical protein
VRHYWPPFCGALAPFFSVIRPTESICAVRRASIIFMIAPYGAIMKMMDALRLAQIDSVGLITEKKGGNAPSKGGQ